MCHRKRFLLNKNRPNTIYLNLILIFVYILFSCYSMKSTYPWQRLKALRKINDQVLLGRIVLEDESYEVRDAAFEKITDHVILAEVALKSTDPDIQEGATKKLIDQEVLKQIAINNRYSWIRSIAIEKLTDQKVLEQMYPNCELHLG